MSTTIKFHPLADLSPLMKGAEFDELVADIEANGLRERIDLYQGKIVDGRNRHRALQQLGIDPSADAKKYFREAIYARPIGGGKGKGENDARGNDAPASAGKRRAEMAVLEAASDPGPIPECLRRAP